VKLHRSPDLELHKWSSLVQVALPDAAHNRAADGEQLLLTCANDVWRLPHHPSRRPLRVRIGQFYHVGLSW